MPTYKYIQKDVTIDLLHVNKYNKVCGFTADYRVPMTYPYCLIFPIQLLLLTDKEFPFQAMGVVHLANKINQFAEIACGEVTVTVKCGTDIRYFKGRNTNGYVFQVISEVLSNTGNILWRCESTYLSTHKKENTEKYEVYPDSLITIDESILKPVGSFQTSLKANMGRIYAAVSGDYNPIHLYPFTAKLLGQRGVIM